MKYALIDKATLDAPLGECTCEGKSYDFHCFNPGTGEKYVETHVLHMDNCPAKSPLLKAIESVILSGRK